MTRTPESDGALPMAIGSPQATSGFISENWTIRDVSKKILDLDVYMEQLQFRKNKMGNRENQSTIQFVNNAIEAVKEERAKLISAVEKREGIRCKKWEKDEFKENEKDGNTGNAEEIKKRERINFQRMDNLFSLGRSVKASGIAFDFLKGFPKISKFNKEEGMKKPLLIPPIPEFNNFPNILQADYLKSSRKPGLQWSPRLHTQFNKEEGMKKPLLIPPIPEFKNFPNILQADYLKSSRKPRLQWSTRLHIQFIHALAQLGGPRAATPENILKLMQVDSLTIDDVKSYLQLFLVHRRKLPPVPSSKPSNSQLGSPEGPLHLDGSSRGIYEHRDGGQ